jgi:lipopolysaccharide biosynthesis protein
MSRSAGGKRPALNDDKVAPMVPPNGCPRTLAFYLPQFHAIPENNQWWGEGFTEWTNVRKALPQFDGHDHPRVPTELGYYDLSDPEEVMARQARSAKQNGVDAFCFYTYWFDGHRLLESPVDAHCRSEEAFPFCVSWANESWTRRWDGKESEVLMPQTYAPGFASELFSDFLPYFSHPSYVRVDNKPVFVVHRVDQIPNPHQVAAEWRQLAIAAGLTGIHLVAAETKWGLDPRSFGFDAVAEFPPVGSNTLSSTWRAPLRNLKNDFRGRILSYEKLVDRFTRRPEPAFIRYPGVAPGWDNTARRNTAATVYVGSTPESYRSWLSTARSRETALRGGTGLVFINAWNEWAEGAYLESDATWGDKYATATRWDAPFQRNEGVAIPKGRWGRAQVLSVGRLALGSALAAMRQLRLTYEARRH